MKVFVTVGTTRYPFARLIDTAIAIASENQKNNFIIQSGVYQPEQSIPSNVQLKNYLPFPIVQQHLQQADIIVCHAGMGTIIQAWNYKKKPIVVPRQHKFGEHANDHETDIANFLHKKNLIIKETEATGIKHWLIKNKVSKSQSLKKSKKLVNYLQQKYPLDVS